MKKDVKACWGFTIAFSSVFILLTVLVYYRRSANTVIFGVCIPLFIFCVWLMWCVTHHKLRAARRRRSQTDDVEMGEGENSTSSDTPPKYEAVVSKPPPYEYLFDTPKDMSPICELELVEREPCDSSTDSDLPPYSAVALTHPPV